MNIQEGRIYQVSVEVTIGEEKRWIMLRSKMTYSEAFEMKAVIEKTGKKKAKLERMIA